MKVRERGPWCIAGENLNWYSHYENSMGFPQNSKNRTTIQFSNYTSIYLEKKKKKRKKENTNSKHPVFHCCLTAKIWMPPK